jgi:signal transduction histidine kinase/ActR/RegA family two-component response regulator
MDAVSGFATLVWPPSGLALAGLLLLGRRLWPGIALGAFLVNAWMGAPPPVAVGIALGNTLEAVAAAWLLGRLEFSSALTRLRDASAYVVVAATAATALGATIGTLSLFSGHIVLPAHFGETWRAWWLGDAIGVLVVAPPLLAWGTGPSREPGTHALIEAVAMACVLLLLCAGVFGSPARSAGPFHQPYILFAVTIWAALRFGQRGTATTTFAMAGLSILATAFELGPFAGHGLASSLSFLQVFVASVAVTGLFLGAAVSERAARANELARVNAELSNALKARDAFLSVASHELKTPLSALQLQTDVLLRLHKDMPESMAEKLHRINRQVGRLNKLVVQLLEVSRIRDGRLELEPERVELNALVREVASRFEEQARSAKSALHVRSAGRVFGSWDPLRLDQVISNLLANAVKYGAGKPIEVEVSAAEQRALVRVRDYGVGVAPADQARIFDRFERAHAQNKVEGFGLGLWISKQIVDTMGGAITVSSTPGIGSAFTVELPCLEIEPARDGQARGSDPARSARDILIVEDDEDVLDGVAHILRAEGYRVTCASDGRQALAWLEHEQPAMMLLDLGMPVMNGPELLRELRASGAPLAFPVVLLSADDQLPRKAEELGVRDYMEKPLQIDTLLALVARHAGAVRAPAAAAVSGSSPS